MPEHEFLETRILVDGTPLDEYVGPQDGGTEDGDIVRYVEATAGKQFKVQVKWKPGYPLKETKWLYCRLKMTGSVKSYSEPCRSSERRHGVLSAQREHVFDHVRIKDLSGQWKRMLFNFGVLEFTDGTNNQEFLTPSEMKSLGSIKVVFYRVSRKAKAAPEPSLGITPHQIDTLSEELLKGQDVENTIKYQLTEQEAKPSRGMYDYVPLPGDAGKKTTFVFRYRSRDTLKSLDCIPRTPSPEPEIASGLECTDEMLRQEKERRQRVELENDRLRQQVEHFQQLAGGGSSIGSTVAQKRERDIKDEDDDEDQKPPASTRARVIIEIDDD